MNPNKALWEKGDFTQIAQTIRRSEEDVVRHAGVTAGMHVLDVGCGDGSTALPAARLGAEVLGVDISSYLVAAGNRRAAEAGLSATCRFVEGDACELAGIGDRRFDLVISLFGAMFAPKPLDVARALVRVTRPGGRILMGNWIPGDPTLVAQTLKIVAAYLPPPPEGFVSPMAWGLPANVIDRFGAAGIAEPAIHCERATLVIDFDGSPAQYVDINRRCYAPLMNAFEAAVRDGREPALYGELLQLVQSQNQSRDPAKTSIPATFLKVTVQVA